MKPIEWLKNNKLTAALIVVITYLLLQTSPTSYKTPSKDKGSSPVSPTALEFQAEQRDSGVSPSENRVVIQNSYLSLLVKDVQKTSEDIVSHAKTQGGFMVETSYSKPEESPYGVVTVRIPTNKLEESLKYFRSLGVKVVSENLLGEDVTDSYTDLETRLSTLRKTKAKFEEILAKAAGVQDVLTAQREITNLEQQIDYLIGQQKSIEKSAALTKITVNLSTDELALPYAPDEAFRPNVIFKLAVRSLVDILRLGAEGLIWVAVFSVLWLPALFGWRLYKKRFALKKVRKT